MKTDKLFYEYFQVAPYALFELLQITPECEYHFESPVIKASERRMDGLLEPAEPAYPYYFLEVQGYLDTSIYWRTVHQIGWFHEQRPKYNGREWKAIILFLDDAYDPGPETLGSLYHDGSPWLMRHTITDLLRQVESASPVLNVLRPLIAKNRIEVEQQSARWVNEIKEAEDDKGVQKRLLDLLAEFIVQKFSRLTREEIDKMLQLTPIEQTVVGQELIMEGIQQGIQQGMQRGLQRGLQQGMQQGILEGQFLLLADMIMQKYGQTVDIKKLARLDNKELRTLGQRLLWTESYHDIDEWVNGRLAEKNNEN